MVFLRSLFVQHPMFLTQLSRVPCLRKPNSTHLAVLSAFLTGKLIKGLLHDEENVCFPIGGKFSQMRDLVVNKGCRFRVVYLFPVLFR